jgi:hypothetical protein
MLQTKLVEKLETHILCSIFFFENRAVYEILGGNFTERGRPHLTIWCTRIACWVRKATNTHTSCVVLIGFPLQQWLYEQASMLRYTYTACRVEHLHSL